MVLIDENGAEVSDLTLLIGRPTAATSPTATCCWGCIWRRCQRRYNWLYKDNWRRRRPNAYCWADRRWLRVILAERCRGVGKGTRIARLWLWNANVLNDVIIVSELLFNPIFKL